MSETLLSGSRAIVDPRVALAAVRGRGAPSLLLESAAPGPEAWEPLVALAPRRIDVPAGGLPALERLVTERRREGGPRGTGLAVLLSYDAMPGIPPIVALAVDAAIRFPHGEPPVVAHRTGVEAPDLPASPTLEDPRPATLGKPATSLPREAYLRAVEAIRERIRAGDVYQANLAQRLEAAWAGDPLDLYRKLPVVPRAAFLEVPGVVALASASPETFLRIGRDGAVETWPIKGTRPRGATEDEDRAAAADLLASEKDRAELLMIVDLERNDLGRVSLPGSIEVPEIFALRSYPTVHHLVARVKGRLRPDTGLADVLRAAFPGGSITGAPKRSAIRILAGLEPVPRGPYTGSLLWLGDDGTTESSILIRTIVVAGGRAYVGAGGGVVFDSDPESEWRESSHKARALTRALGFEPEEAS
jgi:anthranilate/para-aminobenzoate synthase component I